MRKALSVVVLMLLPVPAGAQVVGSPPPDLGGPYSPTDPNSIYCRPPQHQTDSAPMGPKVCMTNRQWNDLHAQGFDIGPDGRKVSQEKHVNMLSHGVALSSSSGRSKSPLARS